MSKHDDAWKAREDARRAMLEATAELASSQASARLWASNLERRRSEFIEADRKFHQLLAADSAGVLGNVAQVEHAGGKPKT